MSDYGPPQTGKTVLRRTLNAMQGLSEEGLPMGKGNTRKGELRALSQVSGLTKALLEGNKQETAKFDFESILLLYNYGNPLQTRAMTSNDNRTIEMPFLASLAFVMNTEPFKSRASKERIISNEFKTEFLNDQTKIAFLELSAMKAEEMLSFMVIIMKNRKWIEANWQCVFETARDDLQKDIHDNRICENHALILAFFRIICITVGYNFDLRPFIVELALKKIESCKQRDVTSADYFFECLNSLPENFTGIQGDLTLKLTNEFMKIEKKELHVCIPLARQAIAQMGMQTDFPATLLKELKAHESFIDGNRNLRFNGTQRKAMIFDATILEMGGSVEE